nr:putative GH32 family protein [Limonius californicus]
MAESSLFKTPCYLFLFLIIGCSVNASSETKSNGTQKPIFPKKAVIPSKEEWYPTYHLSPPSGWMNDPNGLIWFDGYYHAFYQHNPDAAAFGLMCWGHARSKDMITWEHLPVALRPSIEADSNGCFSGSAVDNNGTLTLIYTGNGFDRQTQCLASSQDTINFTNNSKVLDAPGNNPDFRDPKVWRESNTWYMVAGIRVDDGGQVLLYKSDDLHDWQSQGVLAKGDDSMGFMWECPDFFLLENKHILLMSPQGIQAQGYNNRNLFQSGYYLGTWQPGGQFNIEQDFIEIDNGHDFYATQTFLAPDGRRIMIAWASMWESPLPEREQKWAGMLSLPRELTLQGNGRVRVRPIAEIENYRLFQTQINNRVLEREYVELENTTKAMEIITVWDLKQSDAEKYGLRLGDENLAEAGVYLYVDTQAQRLVLDRRYPQYGISGYRSVALPYENLLTLRVFFDSSSLEVFVNDGEASLTSRIYPLENQRHLALFAENGRATLQNSSRWRLGRE